jgi:hypothetical protein
VDKLPLIAAALLLGAVSSASTASAQNGNTSVVVGDHELCASCQIELELVATLTPKQESGFFCSAIIDLAVVGSLFYAIDLACSDPVVLVFNQGGQQIGKLGGMGQGPGEFLRVRRIWSRTDGGLYVFEPGRLSLFSPAFEFERVIPLRSVPDGFLPLPDGRFIVADNLETPESVGLPLHIFDDRGRRIRSFGADSSIYRSDEKVAFSRTLAGSSTPNTLWVAHTNQYKVEKWNIASESRVLTLERRPRWFQPSTSTVGPSTRLTGVREDGSGNLWTLISVPTDEHEVKIADGALINDHLDTIVEILDPKAGDLLATTRSDVLFARWAGDFTFSVREGADLSILVDVWRATIHRRPN